jgi:peptide/nickel transport system permease protein
MGFLVILGALAIGLFVGSIAGYLGGPVDIVMMRFADVFFAFPAVLLAIVLVRAIPSTLVLNLGSTRFQTALSGLDKIVVVLVLIRWPFYARLIRSEIMKVKNEDYVEAARCIGCSGRRVLFRHILPNSIYPILTMAFLDIGGVVLLATTLTFLGLGPQTGYAEWGSIINSSQGFIVGSLQDPLRYGYTFIFPAIFISAFVLAWSLVGDKLRELSDPAIRGRRT